MNLYCSNTLSHVSLWGERKLREFSWIAHHWRLSELGIEPGSPHSSSTHFSGLWVLVYASPWTCFLCLTSFHSWVILDPIAVSTLSYITLSQRSWQGVLLMRFKSKLFFPLPALGPGCFRRVWNLSWGSNKWKCQESTCGMERWWAGQPGL